MAKTVLVVDDLKDTRDLMRFLLENLGYQVLEAEDGWKAVESVKKQIPDLISKPVDFDRLQPLIKQYLLH